MHFVSRSPCPTLLAKNQVKWTKPWLDYYGWGKYGPKKPPQPKKPSSSHWLKNEIRLLLLTDFQSNCGYCGCSVPILPQKPDNPMTEQARAQLKNSGNNGLVKAVGGDVDHFLAKAKYPEHVYEWTNYILACKNCNTLKSNFDDIKHPLFNPCQQNDCQQLAFNEDTGRYSLAPQYQDDAISQQRFNNTDKATYINAEDHCTERKNTVMLLRGCFESIERLTPLKNIPIISMQIEEILNEIEIHKAKPAFKLLIDTTYQKSIGDYPLISVLLNAQ